ncbi:hypothetical protein [Helicovermis profundi]|uniref:Uncharacterized protein n=1 Tax=Helicovermis profundi TaxID=3065157 RepID=A0AAU9E6Q0_9FIRM|nr:hypothetical protein HLPR_27300 [Clostridia bacterium S502]
MYSRVLALVLGSLIICSSFLVSFGDDNVNNVNKLNSLTEEKMISNEELSDSFEVIEPKIKVKKEILLRDNLLISIALLKTFGQSNVPITMNLYKIEPKIEKLIVIDDIKDISELSKFSILLKDNSQKEDGLNKDSESKIVKSLDDDSLNTSKYIELPKFTLDYKDMTTIELIEAYKILDFVKTKKLDELELLYKKIVLINEETSSEKNVNEEIKYSNEDQKVIDDYNKISLQFAMVDSNIESVNKILDVETLIPEIEKQSIKKNGILPFYKYTVENILNGEYRLEFVREDSNEVIKKINFFVNRKEELTKEKILQDIPSTMEILNSKELSN